MKLSTMMIQRWIKFCKLFFPKKKMNGDSNFARAFFNQFDGIRTIDIYCQWNPLYSSQPSEFCNFNMQTSSWKVSCSSGAKT